MQPPHSAQASPSLPATPPRTAACAQTRLRQWDAAVDSLTRAVNDYGLKLSVALKDPDLEALRERREWLEGLANMRGAASAGPGGGRGVGECGVVRGCSRACAYPVLARWSSRAGSRAAAPSLARAIREKLPKLPDR